jgi:hypothetical protein
MLRTVGMALGLTTGKKSFNAILLRVATIDRLCAYFKAGNPSFEKKRCL